MELANNLLRRYCRSGNNKKISSQLQTELLINEKFTPISEFLNEFISNMPDISEIPGDGNMIEYCTRSKKYRRIKQVKDESLCCNSYE